MPITFSPVITGTAQGGPMFSGSIEEGRNIQQSSVITGSRAGSATFEGIEIGKGNVVVPPSNGLCTTAKTQLTASTPTAITLNVGGSTLADAICTSLSASVSQGQEVQINIGFEGGVATVAAPSGAAAASYTPKTSADCSITVDAAPDSMCITSMSVDLSGQYERIACIGEAAASKGFAGQTTCTGSVTYFAPGGVGDVADGSDLVLDFGGFTVNANNVMVNKKISIDGPTGASITVDFTARSPVGTLDACFS